MNCKNIQIEKFNSIGSKVVYEKNGDLYSLKINTQGFQFGLFLAKVTMQDNEIVTSKFIIK